jgi:excisionase family DNA binding protein
MPGDADKDLLLTAVEIAYLFEVSKTTVYILMQSGELPTVWVGRRVRVRLRDLERFVLENNGLNGKEQTGVTRMPRP